MTLTKPPVLNEGTSNQRDGKCCLGEHRTRRRKIADAPSPFSNSHFLGGHLEPASHSPVSQTSAHPREPSAPLAASFQLHFTPDIPRLLRVTCTGDPAAAAPAGRAEDLVPMSCRLKLSPCRRLLADAAPRKRKEIRLGEITSMKFHWWGCL